MLLSVTAINCVLLHEDKLDRARRLCVRIYGTKMSAAPVATQRQLAEWLANIELLSKGARGSAVG